MYLVFGLSVAVMLFSLVNQRNRLMPKTAERLVETERTATNILVRAKKIDVGKVNSRDAAKADFFVLNVGKDTLFVEKVDVSCSCSTLTASDIAVAPGDSAKITVAYTKTVSGYFYSDVLIYGNFPNSPAILGFEGYLLGTGAGTEIETETEGH